MWGAPPARSQGDPPIPLHEIQGHRSWVFHVEYLSGDGRAVLSGSSTSLIVWQAETGRETRRLIDGEQVFPFAASPDGNRVFVWTRSGARILDPLTGAIVLEFDPERTGLLFSPIWSPAGDRIATRTRDAVHIWDATGGNQTQRLELAFRNLPIRAWSPDGERIAVLGRTGESAGFLVVFRIADGEREFETQAHEARAATLLTWSPDGSRLATGAYDGLVKIWDTSDWALSQTLEGKSDVTFNLGIPIDVMEFSPDSRNLAVGGTTLWVWDTETGEELHRWSAGDPDRAYIPHFGGITDVAISPDGLYLASSGLDGTAKLWDLTAGTQVANMDSFLNSVEDVDWSPDGSRFAAASRDGKTIIWDRTTLEETARFEGHLGGAVSSLAFSPRGRRLVTAGTDGAVKVWYTETGGQLFELPPLDEPTSPFARPVRPARPVSQLWYSPAANRVLMLSEPQAYSVLESRVVAARIGRAVRLGESVRSAAWSPDGHRVATSGYGVTVWDLDRLDAEPIELDPDRGASDEEVRHVAWSRDGQRLLTASATGASAWDLRSRTALVSVDPEGGASYVEESPDGSLLLTIDRQFQSPRVQVWDSGAGTEVARLDRPPARVQGARFLPDGERIVTRYSRDPAVRVWEARSGRELLALEGHSRRVRGVAVSPDGRQIATASDDRTARLWDAENGAKLAVLEGHLGAVVGVDFSADGSEIATYGSDGAKIWSTGR